MRGRFDMPNAVASSHPVLESYSVAADRARDHPYLIEGA